jgi:hypothetical protein
MAKNRNVLNSTRVIAAGRLLLAEFLFFCATTDSVSFGFRNDVDDNLAIAYLAVAVLLAIVAWKSWWWDFVLFPLVSSLDILVLVIIILFMNLQISKYSLISVAMTSYILLCASVRWTWRTAIIFAIFINIVNILSIILGEVRGRFEKG